MKSRWSIIVLGIITGLFVTTLSVFAYEVPGVTIPYNSELYYDPVLISEADSTYSIFTMRDLARNGFQVVDVKLNSQSIISQLKTLTDKLNSITKLMNQATSMMSLSSDKLNQFMSKINTSLSSITIYGEQREGALLGSVTPTNVMSKFLDYEKNLYRDMTSAEKKEQERIKLNTQESTNKNALRAAQMGADSSSDEAALNTALTALSNAEGEKAAEQASGQIDGVAVSAKAKKNILLSNILAQYAVIQQAEVDKKVKNREDQWTAGFNVADPYHPTEQQQRDYTRPTGIGLINY